MGSNPAQIGERRGLSSQRKPHEPANFLFFAQRALMLKLMHSQDFFSYSLYPFFLDSQGLSSYAHVEGLQERSQCALEDYIRTQYPNQPTRFGKLLLRLPSLRLIRPGTVEVLFFPPVGLGNTVESAVNEMLVISSSPQVAVTSPNSWPATPVFPNCFTVGNMTNMSEMNNINSITNSNMNGGAVM